MECVFLLLGSNLGQRQLLLQQAINNIEKDIAPVLKVSSVYETAPWGKTDQANYLNQVICLKTDLPPADVLKKVLHIEQLMGRERLQKWGARTIDIDILFYGSLIVNEPGLTIPHPELHKRRFTLEPLAEIAPDLMHPILNDSILNIKNNTDDCLLVKKL